MSVSATVREAWRANTHVNRALLSQLGPEMMAARTPGGGYTVAEHLAHMIASIQYWGGLRDRERFGVLSDPALERREDGGFVPETDLVRLGDIGHQTEAATLEVSEAESEGAELPPGRWESPHATPDAYLIHRMIHDAHHRGQVLLALKGAGFALPDGDVVWGSWRGE